MSLDVNILKKIELFVKKAATFNNYDTEEHYHEYNIRKSGIPPNTKND